MEFHPEDTLGALDNAAIAEYLMSIDDFEGAKLFCAGQASGQLFEGKNCPYTFTGMVVGFIESFDVSQSLNKCLISSAAAIEPDRTLINQQIKITLDKFYVENYPGRGQHNILCEFSGKNQVADETEGLRFTFRLKAEDQQSAAVSGQPIFLGLTVGANGISFEGQTINVSSKTDDELLSVLDSDTFKQGLSLLSVAQPAIKPFSTLAAAMVKSTLSRSKNKSVFCFNLGLDFNKAVSSSRLRLGTYIVVQANEHQWDWGDYYWDSTTQSLRMVDSNARDSLGYNYIVFGVSSYTSSVI